MVESKGAYRVGLDFNPSGDPQVQEIKSRAADLIDAIEDIRVDPNRGNAREVARLRELAQNTIEEGAMWAVKAATKRDPLG